MKTLRTKARCTVQDEEEMTLDEDCQVAKAACEQLATWDVELAFHVAARAAKRLENKGELAPLLRDESRAVHVYTQDSLFYKEINNRLSLLERENLKSFFPYLKQFREHSKISSQPEKRISDSGG